jgi:hypothetical protein
MSLKGSRFSLTPFERGGGRASFLAWGRRSREAQSSPFGRGGGVDSEWLPKKGREKRDSSLLWSCGHGTKGWALDCMVFSPNNPS